MDGRWVVDVASVGDVQAAVRGARADGSRLRVVGARGVERFAPGAVAGAEPLSMRGLAGITVAARDFSVRVGAGVLASDLDEVLAPLGLVWPVRRLEAPGTVGGLIGSGRGTTSASQDGPARRWVLGARLVDGTGEVLTVGGATVKNSVGYGVTHALWGSEGRLGAIVELTLRVRGRRDGDEEAGEVLEREVLDAAVALVRCEDLAPGTAEPAVDGMAGAERAVASSDGLRAVGCYSERNLAEADAAVLRGIGIGAWIEDGVGRGDSRPEPGCPEDPHPSPLPQGAGDTVSRGVAVAWGALDPDGVFG
ncbi:MAG: FAD-binding protein [Chloroflexi bacterium]|nr:FAD-binding protein [Chloroflexota bacterium]